MLIGKKGNALVTAITAYLVCGLAHFCVAQAKQGPNEVLVGPVTIPADYVGIDLSIPAKAYLNISTSNSGINLAVRLIGDLGAPQSKIGQVIDSFPLPKDNCASRGLGSPNPVVTVWGKQLLLSGITAMLALHGNVVAWTCLDNPVPNSKVEWRNDGPFHLSIPHLVTWPGDPIKTIIAAQPFDISLPISLQVVDDHTVTVKPGQPNITLGGQYVALTNGILRIAGIDINSKAAEALSHAIDPDKLQQALPPEVLKLNPKITKAEFIDISGILGVELDLAAAIPPDQLTGLFETILAKKP